MYSFERNGITIEQCQQCRGIFLDRGELEQLIDAAESSYAGPPPSSARAGYPPQGYPQAPGYGPGYGYGGRPGFLGNMFGYGGHHGGHHGHHDD